MLDAGGGGGGGGTNWWSMDTPTMWAHISDIDTEPMWKQASGWQKAIDLASTNLYRLKDFREQLVTAWPPEKSEASQAYVTKLDELIKSVQDVYDGAVTNKTSATNLASAIGEAKYKVKPLYDEWLKNLGTQSTYDQNLAAKKSQLADTYGADSGSYKSALSAWQRSNPDPSVASKQEALDNQARTAMSNLSTDLVVSKGNMVEPQPYTPPTLAGKPRDDGGGDSGSTGSTGSTGSSNSFSSSSSSMPPVVPMPSYIPPSQPSLTGSTYVPTPTAPTPMPTAPTLPGAPPTGPIGMPPAVPPVGPQGVIKPNLPPTTTGRPGPLGPNVLGQGKVPNGLPGGGRPLVGPQGIIGGQPGGRPGAGGLTSRGVNPAGGVIGGRGGAAGGPGAAGRGGAGVAGGRGAGMVGAGAGGRGRKGEDEHGNEWDPDNPWEVAEGVNPVVDAPGDTGPIDPGPAIGGRW
ncbi:MAG: hypothetical protein HOU81_15760 [Hamadaea sp.]|uniref:hypothetical protein n=1 Tax=Hamadaea sp. TaxID=2024425 RepID=UPI0017D07176|nr:hypothetical protein [Hamadaea sp.]NUR72269.1 hypothetical protein [Hamadaea sp.]NUT23225.1 hypothetical protein [Hamadaea sp.]